MLKSTVQATTIHGEIQTRNLKMGSYCCVAIISIDTELVVLAFSGITTDCIRLMEGGNEAIVPERSKYQLTHTQDTLSLRSRYQDFVLPYWYPMHNVLTQDTFKLYSTWKDCDIATPHCDDSKRELNCPRTELSNLVWYNMVY